MVKINGKYLESVVTEAVKTQSGVPIPHRVAIKNPDTDEVLEVVSDKYKIVQNRDLLNAIMPVVEDLGMNPEPTIRTAKNGAMTFFKFHGNANVGKLSTEIQVGDIVRFGAEFFNSYDKSIRLGFHITAERLACLNGMVVPGTIQEIFVRHVGSVTADSISTKLENFFDDTAIATRMWQRWGLTHPEDNNVEIFLTKNLGKHNAADFLKKYNELPDERKTLWELYNIVTYHITHDMKTRKEDLLSFRQFQLGEKISNSMDKFFAGSKT